MPLFTITSLLPPLLVTIIALTSARLMVRDTSATDNHEFASIDGLRGFLALFVFLHHAAYWFNYAHFNNWVAVNYKLYMNFGQTSVCLFFMLSGFLFCHKLLGGRDKEIDWLKLFCARFLRITPLYFTLIAIMLLVIGFQSNFTQLEATVSLRNNIIDWLLFTAPGHPDINAHANTHLLVAGVIWTLPYEWYFYFCLPVLGLLLGSKSKPRSGIWLVLSIACVISFTHWRLDPTLLFGFVGGGIAAVITRTPWLRKLHQGKGVNWVLLAGLIISYTIFDNATFYTRLLILTVCMSFIACGANLFGILDSRAARSLSTVSYGVYLLHGIFLHIVMTYLLTPQMRHDISELQYWLVIFICTPALIGLSSLSWYFIEWPAIKSLPALTGFLSKFHLVKPFSSPLINRIELAKASKKSEQKSDG